MRDDHASNFPANWWNDRRSRGYYVDAGGYVKLRLNSEPANKLCAKLLQEAKELEDGLCDKTTKDAALYRARGVMYRAMMGAIKC